MKKVLVVSDLHAGSIYANWPEDLPIKGGGYWTLSGQQKHLSMAWEALIDKVEELKPDILVINGDSIDGCNRKSDGIPTVTTDFADQVKAAERLLRPIRDVVGEAYLIRGTEYHDTKNGQAIEMLGAALQVVPFREEQYSDWVLNLEVDGVILNFCHHISVMQGFYRATAPDREGIWSALAGKHKVPDADCVVRSHVHIFVHVEHSEKHIVITPCWEMRTDYMIKKSYYRMLPEIGAILIYVDGDKKRAGEDPIDIQKILFLSPPELLLTSNV
jgi:hypothetical protein